MGATDSFDEARKELKGKRDVSEIEEAERKEQIRYAGLAYEMVHDLMVRQGWLEVQEVIEGATPGHIGSGHSVEHYCLLAQAHTLSGETIVFSQTASSDPLENGAITMEIYSDDVGDEVEGIVFKENGIEDDEGNRVDEIGEKFADSFKEYLAQLETGSDWGDKPEDESLLPKEDLIYPCRKSDHMEAEPPFDVLPKNSLL